MARSRRSAPAVNIGPIAVPSALPIPGRLGVDHVVMVMMENRSFDHFLGWLPNANGIGLGPDGAVIDARRFESFVYEDASGRSHPIWHTTQLNGCGQQDQDHGYVGGRVQWDKGKMDGFVTEPDNTTYALSYYLADARPFSSRLALEYATCDNYFCSYLGPTWPNRFFQLSAQTDRLEDSLAPAGSPKPASPSVVPSIFDQLNQLSGPTGRYYFSDLPFTAFWGERYLPISAQYPQFLADAAAGALPNVSVVDPRFEDEGSGTSGDDHPLADLRAGDAFLSEVFHALADGPAWERTMLVVNYDEWGGFFDHVPPPYAAPGNQYIDTVDIRRAADGSISRVLTGSACLASSRRRSPRETPTIPASSRPCSTTRRFSPSSSAIGACLPSRHATRRCSTTSQPPPTACRICGGRSTRRGQALPAPAVMATPNTRPSGDAFVSSALLQGWR